MGWYWNDAEPYVYLALFTWLATIKEGRSVLKDFSAKADPIFAQPTYLCFVVLQSVNKIVSHLLDISVLEGVVKYDKKNNPHKFNKYRLLLYFYVAKRYIQALTYCSADRKERTEVHRQVTGKDIVQMTGVTQVLFNLPRQYQLWNKTYRDEIPRREVPQPEKVKQKRTKNKATTGKENNAILVDIWEKPFDLKQRLHESFRNWENNDVTTVQLDNGWDPLHIAMGFHDEKYPALMVNDFCKDPVQLYAPGEEKIQGESIDTPTKRKREPKSKTEPETKITSESLKEIICRYAKGSGKQATYKGSLKAWNGIANEIMTKITGAPPEEAINITAKDIMNVKPASKPTTDTQTPAKKRKNGENDDTA